MMRWGDPLPNDEEPRRPRLDPAITKGIVSGLIASALFLVLVQPILRGSWTVMAFTASHLYAGMSDRLYLHTAQGRETFRLWGYMFILLPLVFATGTIWASLSRSVSRDHPSAVSASKVTRYLASTRSGRGLLRLLGPVVFLLWAPLAILEWGEVELSSSFRQRVAILAPYLTDREEKELRAAWAAMTHKLDYDKINEHIEGYAKQRGVTLPRARP
jgi:hypothetical protein